LREKGLTDFVAADMYRILQHLMKSLQPVERTVGADYNERGGLKSKSHGYAQGGIET